MKNMAVFFAVMALALLSCNNGMSNVSGARESGQNRRADRSQRTVIDAGKYVDLTSAKVNAREVKKEDVLSQSYGDFQIENGNSQIRIDSVEGTVTMTSDDAFYQGGGGKQMYAKYRFETAAASDDCLYIKPGKKTGAVLLIGSDKFEGEAVPDLVVCLPLYGFGQNRIAVSPVMNGYIGMPSGTYWKKR
jgi:hypothetical protein